MMHSENEGAAEDTEEEIEEEAEEESEDDGKVEFEQLTNSCNNKTFRQFLNLECWLRGAP